MNLERVSRSPLPPPAAVCVNLRYRCVCLFALLLQEDRTIMKLCAGGGEGCSESKDICYEVRRAETCVD